MQPTESSPRTRIAMDCSTSSYRLGLQQIVTVAQSIKPSLYSALSRTGHGIQTPSKTHPNPNPDSTPLALALPLPDEIISSLLSLGCPQDSARSLSNAFIDSARRIRDAYEVSYRKLTTQFASDPERFSTRVKNTRSLLERKYREQILTAEQVASDQAKKLRQVQSTKAKPMFNQEFVPLLEAYFEYNAYPSAPDRASLAKSSMMTTRQIEVWFQNHRNRAKKEGRSLQRLSNDPLPAQVSIETLEKRMPSFFTPENHKKSCTSITPSDQWLSSRKNEDESACFLFTLHAPPHAFPMIYPPSCDYEPFPTKTGQHKFPTPVWTRKPATSCFIRNIPDMDELILDFTTKLRIRSSSQSHPPSTSKHPWFAATHTVPLTAPHPALVRSTSSPIHTSSLLSFPPSSSRLRRHPSRLPTPDFGIETVTKGSVWKPKKVTHLPRRMPKSVNHSHRGVSPIFSDVSSSPRIPSSSRSSSFTFISSSGGRISSSSSSSSSTPSTPDLGPTSLPDDDGVPYVVGVDFQDKENLRGYFVDDSAQIDGIQWTEETCANPFTQSLHQILDTSSLRVASP